MKKEFNEKKVLDLIEDMRGRLDDIEMMISSASKGKGVSKRYKLLHEIYKRGGSISWDEFRTIAKKLGYKRWGSFFKGTNKSLTGTYQNGEEKVALTRAGVDSLKSANLIEENGL